MANIEFNEGEVVQLKSGGQKMTVEGFTWDSLNEKYRDDKVNCVWADSKGNMNRGTFRPTLLEHI